MGEDQSSGNSRAGEGKITSASEAKDLLGRSTFVRTGQHQGRTSNPTERLAASRLAKRQVNEPTELDKEPLFNANKQTVKIYEGLGFTKEQIYDILNNSQD